MDNSYTKWELELADLITVFYNITEKDAIGIIEAQPFYTSQAWSKGLSAYDSIEFFKTLEILPNIQLKPFIDNLKDQVLFYLYDISNSPLEKEPLENEDNIAIKSDLNDVINNDANRIIDIYNGNAFSDYILNEGGAEKLVKHHYPTAFTHKDDSNKFSVLFAEYTIFDNRNNPFSDGTFHEPEQAWFETFNGIRNHQFNLIKEKNPVLSHDIITGEKYVDQLSDDYYDIDHFEKQYKPEKEENLNTKSNINHLKSNRVMENQNVSDVQTEQPVHLNSKGKEIQKGDLVSYKKGENNYIRGVVEEIDAATNRSIAVVKQLQKDGYGDKHTFDINDTNLHVMTKGQKYDIRELQDLFKNGMYGKKLDDAFKQKGVLFALTRGYRTPVIKNFQTQKTDENGVKSHHSFDAKVKVYGPSGNLKVKCDIAKKELVERPEIFGKKFTPEMWKDLKENEHLGLVEGFAKPSTGEVFNAYVSLDKDINDLVFLNENAIDISKFYKTELTEKQQSDLKAGKEVVIEVDFGKKGKEKMPLRVDATKEGLVKSSNELGQSKSAKTSKSTTNAKTKESSKVQGDEKKKSKGVKM